MTTKTMRKDGGQRRIASALCAGLIACACAPIAAWAQSNTDSTQVTVEAKGTELLEYRVPTELPFHAAADGTLTGPSPEACQIVNESIFGIHVTQVGVTPSDGWSLAADVLSTSVQNAIDFQFGPQLQINAIDAVSETMDVSKDASFNMGYAGSDTAAIDIDSSGSIARVSMDLTKKASVATISWTVAPGAAATS